MNGVVYCLRNDLAPVVLWYNAPLMKKWGYPVPTAWPQYEQIGEEVARQHPGYIVASAGDTFTPEIYMWASQCQATFYPFGVYLTYIYFSTALPRDLLAAARIDGCTEFGAFRRIALPLAAPVVVLVGFFSSRRAASTGPDGRLNYRHALTSRDGVDDFYETFFNWPQLYLLGGADDLLAATERHWEGVTAQLTELGMLKDEYERGYDWFHQGESMLLLYFLTMANPVRWAERAVRFAELYVDPAHGNYAAARRIIQRPHNGSDPGRTRLFDGTHYPWLDKEARSYGFPLDWLLPAGAPEPPRDADPRLTGAMTASMGEGDTYPEEMLAAAQAQVRHWLVRMRCWRDADITEPDIHVWQQSNPVVTEALVQLTWGGPQVIYNGDLYDYGHSEPEVTEHQADVQGPWLTVGLPASTRIRLTLTLALRSRKPSYATPFTEVSG